jgi:hypothetical protein
MTTNTVTSENLSLKDRYLALFNEAEDYRKQYAGWVISNLEKSQGNLWYANIIDILKSIAKNEFFNTEQWCSKLKDVREKIYEKSKHTDQHPERLPDEICEQKIQQLKHDVLKAPNASGMLNAAVKADFLSGIIKEYKSDSADVENYFKESVHKYVPIDFRALVNEIPDVIEWLAKLSQITLTFKERHDYLYKTTSVPADVQQRLLQKRVVLANEVGRLQEEQLSALVSDLKKFNFGSQ